MGLFDYEGAQDGHSSINAQDHVDLEETGHWPIWRRNATGHVTEEDGNGPFFPTWQTSPILQGGHEINENLMMMTNTNANSMGARLSFYSGSVVVGNFMMSPADGPKEDDPPESDDSDITQDASERLSMLLSIAHQKAVYYDGSPVSQVYFPIFDSFRSDRKTVAVMVAWIHWIEYFRDILPSSMEGLHAVLRQTCSGDDEGPVSYTFNVKGETATAVGKGDLHDESFDNMVQTASLDSVESIGDGTRDGLPFHHDHCTVNLAVYPTKKFHNAFNTNTPIFITAGIGLVFVFAVIMFLIYDRLVERRQKMVMNTANQQNAIVSSLFPENVRERLMQQAEEAAKANKSSGNFLAPSRRLKGYLTGGATEEAEGNQTTSPIADLFPHCTLVLGSFLLFEL